MHDVSGLCRCGVVPSLRCCNCYLRSAADAAAHIAFLSLSESVDPNFEIINIMDWQHQEGHIDEARHSSGITRKAQRLRW